MNRTIKFRAWGRKRIDSEPYMDYEPLIYDGECFGQWSQVNLNTAINNGGDAESPNEQTKRMFMQFTGLLDKNGKEIYEGDVCKWLGGSGQVTWSDNEARWILFDYSGACSLCCVPRDMIEILGSIHENPELLSIHK